MKKQMHFHFPRLRALGLLLGVAVVPLAAQAELPPSAYEEMQQAAPEAVVITVIDTKLRTVKDKRFERTSVFATARVDNVVRSKSGLKKGQVIAIRTITDRVLEPGWVGPGPMPIVESGVQYQAWLKRAGSAFYPVAKGQSFTRPNAR